MDRYSLKASTAWVREERELDATPPSSFIRTCSCSVLMHHFFPYPFERASGCLIWARGVVSERQPTTSSALTRAWTPVVLD
jgi:hypothetical protein